MAYLADLPDYNVGRDYTDMDTHIIEADDSGNLIYQLPGLTYYADVAEPGAESSTGLWIVLAIIAALVLLPGKRTQSTEG